MNTPENTFRDLVLLIAGGWYLCPRGGGQDHWCRECVAVHHWPEHKRLHLHTYGLWCGGWEGMDLHRSNKEWSLVTVRVDGRGVARLGGGPSQVLLSSCLRHPGWKSLYSFSNPGPLPSHTFPPQTGSHSNAQHTLGHVLPHEISRQLGMPETGTSSLTIYLTKGEATEHRIPWKLSKI